MRERLAEHVEVDVRQHVLVTPFHGKKRRIEALQYVIRNRGTQVTTVQVDFSASSGVQLVFPPKNRPQLAQHDPMVFDFIVYPMEQRVMVAVVKDGGERAFVRVQYEVKDVASVPLETIAIERGRRDAVLAQLITRAARTYNGLNADLSRKSEAAVTRLCADINGFNRSKPEIFVDSAFPPSPASLWGSGSVGSVWKSSFAAQVASWRHISEVVDESWCFRSRVNESLTDPHMWRSWTSGLPGQDSLLCAIVAISLDSRWYEQWFCTLPVLQSDRRVMKQFLQQSVVTVNLCRDGLRWTPVLVDLFAPGLTVGGGTCGISNSVGEVYPILLQKAYAKLCGTYASISGKSTRSILRDLTGLPVVQLFPTKECNTIEELPATLVHLTELSRKSNILMVSFQRLDEHHCTFSVVDCQVTSTGESVVRVRDEVEALKAIQATSNDSMLGDSASSLCELKWETFIALEPCVFQLMTDRKTERRIRQIASKLSSDVTTCHFAISTAVLSDLVVNVNCSSLSDERLPSEVTIFHVEDDDSWMELKISDTTSIDTSFQIRFTATPGEYVIAVNIQPSTLQREASSDKWTEASIKSNLQLLFDCLDADMDGLLTDQELLQFLRTVEEVDPVDSTVINSVLDRFASERQQDRDTFGLTSDDLRDVYQHISETFNTSTKNSGFHQHLWRDILQVLAIEPSARFISRENLFQLMVVAHSDGTDLELMALPDL